jgi:hypothetical protein
VGYERKNVQLLGGGFNILPPVDKVPITDYLLAQNWRSDALGRLISRAGYPKQFAIAGAGIAHSAGAAGGPASPYYVGCNSSVTDPASSVYFDGDPTAIATGFDGNRIAFAAQNDYMYVMNRGAQGRHTPNPAPGIPAWQPWNIPAPPASPTAAPSATGPVDASVTYTYAFEATYTDTSIAAGAQTVTPNDVTSISVGMRLGISQADYSNYEIVTVTAVTATTFDAVFARAHPGPTILIAYYDYVHSLTIAGVTYSFVQDGITQAQIPQVMASLAGADPNCAVTYSGSGQDLDITPIVQNTLIAVSGSGGNPDATLGAGDLSNLPNGTYQYYLTFMSADFTLESNASPVSAPVTTTGTESITVTIPTTPPTPNDAPTDPRTGFVNIYRTGGTLGQAYRVGSVASTVASPATTFVDNVPDLQATNNGVTMPLTNDGPPACAGMIGPQLGRLYAWSTEAHPNRVYYTPANKPQYWSTDEQVGDWFDVGLDDEAIVWSTIHTNLLIFYKERSIWMLIGDAVGGTLEQVYDGIGLDNAFALAPAGQIDYFIGPNGLYLFDMAQVHIIAADVLPLFNQSITNAGVLTPPGCVLPGSAFNSRSTASYAIALGHAMGRLYISYAEQGGDYNLLVFDEGPEPERNAYIAARPGRWFYHRNALDRSHCAGGFFGFFFDGAAMIGLTGIEGGKAQGLSIADFRQFLPTDHQEQPSTGPAIPGTVDIECVYQSHYEDCGLPDNDKVFLEIAIDFEFAEYATANVYLSFNNGTVAAVLIGTLAAGARRTQSIQFDASSFPGLAEQRDDGVLARNASVLIDVDAGGVAILHNVYVFYYAEARLGLVASTIPTDLGIGKVKECKELQLDISNPTGGVSVIVASDLPGNALASRQTPTVATMGAGVRAIMKYPFSTTQGLLWQVSMTGTAPFRLYSARLLMRVIGTYVEGYESVDGFIWDSMQQDLGDPDTKTLDQLRFEMDSDGAVSVDLLTDLPGEAFASRGTYVLTTGTTGRAWVTVPLPGAIEGRSVQLQVTGPAGYRLYTVQVRWFRIGRYLAATTPSGNNDAFNTLEFDFLSERRKMFKRLEIDMRADDLVTMSVITDQDSTGALTAMYSPGLRTVNGRATLLVPLPPGIRGRLLRVGLTSAAPARIYHIRVWTRVLSDPAAVWQWEDFPLENSDVLPTWANLVADGTPPNWELADLDFAVSSS